MTSKTINPPANRFEKLKLCRHPHRIQANDIIERIFSDVVYISGDRLFSEDEAIITGFGLYNDKKIAFIAQLKGKDTDARLRRNFGMPHPEGYRKAQRLIHLANRFNCPVISFIDTPGAFPGIGAEERGQSEAIAKSIETMFALKTPSLSIVVGEGGSGGALAIGVTNKIFMLENSIYSVISPEGCASILWKDATKSDLAAENLKATPDDLLELGIIDGIISEGDSQGISDYDLISDNISHAISTFLLNYEDFSSDQIESDRLQKFQKIGTFKKI